MGESATAGVLIEGGNGMPGEILINAAGPGFRFVRKAAFP